MKTPRTHVRPQPRPSPQPQLVSEFQAFKHMECTAPGMIQRASSPLEITLCVKPPLLLRNALPYEMRVLLWQVNSQPGATSMGRGYASPRAAAGEGVSRRRGGEGCLCIGAWAHGLLPVKGGRGCRALRPTALCGVAGLKAELFIVPPAL